MREGLKRQEMILKNFLTRLYKQQHEKHSFRDIDQKDITEKRKNKPIKDNDSWKGVPSPLPMALLKNNTRVLCLAALLLMISTSFLSCDASYGITGIFFSPYSYSCMVFCCCCGKHVWFIQWFRTLLDNQTNTSDYVMSCICTYNFGHGLLHMLGSADGGSLAKFCVDWDGDCKDPVNGKPSQCQIYCRDSGYVLAKGKCEPINGAPNDMCCCYKWMASKWWAFVCKSTGKRLNNKESTTWSIVRIIRRTRLIS